MSPKDPWLGRLASDLTISITFSTRLPLPHAAPVTAEELARASWALPVAGVLVGLIGALAYWLAHACALPSLPAAALAVAATVAVTGCLHEDGLADTADGFGGGKTRDQKLEIMRDSRIGTYGACAVSLSLLLRVSALASLADPELVAWALIGAHATARATMPVLMLLLPPARPDGLSAQAGRPTPASTGAAALLALALLLVIFGFGRGATILLLVFAAFGLMALLCKRQIGGQTGDTMGAVEQVIETVILVSAAAR
jgi:adenosylcobinamide-GDP ribazoletransferase